MKRLITILALAVLLAACAAGDSGAEERTFADGVSPDSGAGTATTAAAAEAVPEEQGAIGVDFEVPQSRKVIRQARLELQADDTRKAFDRIVAVVEAEGGFVANANVYPVESEDDQPQVTMTLRVPTSQLGKVMTAIKGSVAKVVSESQDAQDVTAQYVDLEAQLRNLRALEVELRALLTEVREQPDADPDKLLRVFNEISTVRGQIEQIEGQLQYLDDVVDLATLEVDLTPTPAVVPIVEDTWEPIEVARDALRNLVTGLQGIVDWGINFLLFPLPMLLLILGPPLLIGWFFYRRWRRRRPPTAPASTLPAET